MSTLENLFKIKALLKNVKIHIIPYCHADYAWTHPRKWHIDRYKQIIDEVLNVIKTNNDYYWMADNIFPMLQPCLSEECNIYSEFWQRVNEGRIEITNGIMTLIRPTMTGDETFIRNIVLGKEYLKSIIPDFSTEIFHNVDVSIGHSQLPQILILGGYKFYRGWRPQGAMDKKKIPRQFYWEGIDGTSIICSRGTYAGFWQADYMEKAAFSDNDGSLIAFYNTEIKDILEHSISEHIWVPFGMDDTRPMRDVKDNPVNLDKFMEYFREETHSSISYSTAANYFNELSESELPVHKGILDPCDVGYNISSKGNKGLWHLRILLDRLLIIGETLWAMAVMDGSKYPENDFKEMWNNLLLICSHGMEFVFEEDYQAIYEIAISSVSTVKSLIEEAKTVISGHIPVSGNPTYIIFNTLNWERHAIISLPISKNQPTSSFKLVDSNGTPLNHQLVFKASESITHPTEVLFEASIPPLGYTTIKLDFTESVYPTKAFPSINKSFKPVEIDTGKLRVIFECGAIVSVNGITNISDYDFYLSKIRFTELDQTSKDAWLYNNRRGTISEMAPTKWSWKEFGPLRWKYVVEGLVGRYAFRQEITLYKDRSDMDFKLQLDCSKKGSGFFTAIFPTDENTEFMADIPFGIENRDIINEPYGPVTDIEIDNLERLWEGVFYAKSWINYSIENTNITLIGTDSPRYYWYNPKEKSISIILNRNYILDKCSDWMKNTHHWNENPGVISFSYSANIEKTSQANNFLPYIKAAKEKQNPIEVMQGSFNEASVNTKIHKSYFDINSDSSVISALYFNDGKIILRLYNASNLTNQVRISCCKKILSYKITDFLLNELLEKSPFLLNPDNCIHLNATPWEILTIVLEILI